MNTHVWRNTVTISLCMMLAAITLQADDGELTQELVVVNGKVNVAEEEPADAQEKDAAKRAAQDANTAKLNADRLRALAEAVKAQQAVEQFRAIDDEKLGGPNAKEVLEKAAKKREERTKQFLDTQQQRDQELVELAIEDMTRICQLEEKQIKKLRLAAKGSIDRRISKMKKEMQKAQDRVGDRLGVQLAGRGNDAVEFIAAAQAGFLQVQSRNASPVFESALWKKAYEKTLSDDQKKAYQKSKDDRAKRARQLQVQSYVAELDAQLYLSDKQRNELIALLNETSDGANTVAKAGVRVAAGANRAHIIRRGNVQIHFADGNATVSSSGFHPTAKQREKMDEVLTEKQKAVWKNAGKTGFQQGNAIRPAANILKLRAR